MNFYLCNQSDEIICFQKTEKTLLNIRGGMILPEILSYVIPYLIILGGKPSRLRQPAELSSLFSLVRNGYQCLISLTEA